MPRRVGALLGAALLLAATPAAACTDFTAHGPSHWSIARTAAGPVLRTPCGRPFFSLGVNAVDGGAATVSPSPRAYRWDRFAKTLPAWAAETRQRLLRWGFNTAGAWSLSPDAIGLPSTPELELGRWLNLVWTDPFDPALPPRLDRAAAAAVAPYRGNPLRIGYFSDNEIGWWNAPLFLAYMAYPPENYTKRRLIALLRSRYGGDWRGFVRDFVPASDAASFAALLRGRTPPHLRPGGHGIAVIRRWTGILAGQYYRLMRAALHKADPQALYLGDRLPIYYDPDAVRAMAPFVDAISVNYNIDSADGWIARYFFAGLEKLSGGKPVLVTEWFFAAQQNRSGNLDRTGEPHDKAHARRSNNRNRTGHLMTVTTQAERALGAGRAARLLAAQPDVVGVHWFQYADEPPGGRADGEDYDFGLVDDDNRPYERLVQALAASNRRAPARVGHWHFPAARVVPRAAIDPAEESLADWPKAASLLAMTAAPGDADFGDVYLNWDVQGLNLATIAMDYYAPGLLPPVAPFPRSEAFRIALGVDAGGGPRRFELRVVPTRVERTAADEERLTFAAEVCRYAAQDRCAAAPGATARYFGVALDQPRVILKAFIPWSALGVAGPPADRSMRLALGVTAFYRSRWMSLDGGAPAVAMAHAERWRRFRLGGPAAPDFAGSPLARAGRGAD
jgi:hypothetical protein